MSRLYASYESDTDTDDNSDLDVGKDDRKETTKPVQFGPPPQALHYVPYAPPTYELTKPITTKPPNTLTTLVTSVIVINSKDRDRTVYPDPTFFTLRLPRIYRNIKSISLTEISILNSFFNFNPAKGNVTLPLTESGRSTFNINIRQGTYTSDTLVSELQSALNKTPLFANISFANFKNQFKSSGDFTILFNQPNGEIFNYQTNQYDAATTISQIVAEYFQQQETFGISNFTNNQCAVAYYYPCMKQMILQKVSFNLYPAYYATLQPESTLYPNPSDYILFGFQGLNDTYITHLAIDPTNQVLFQSFHDANTFLQFPVNQYTCIYNSQTGRFQITAPNINTSISTDIATQYNTYLNQLAYQYGYNGATDLSVNLNSNTLLKQVRLEFYNFIQKQFSDIFGTNFGTYTADFYINTNNEVILYNTKDKVGWVTNSNYIPDLLISTFPVNLPDVPVYWPNLQFQYSTITDGISTASFYSTIEIDTNGYIQFSNASEHQDGYFDVPFDIATTSYARLLFHSKMRQTIQLMTIPRYSTNRLSTNNEVYKFGSTISETPFLFSTGSILCDPYTNPIYLVYAMQHVLFNTPDYMRFNGTEWLGYINQENPVKLTTPPAINDINITSFQPYILFAVNAAEMLVMPDATFSIDIYVETQDGNNFPVPVTLSWYRDRSAFMADVEKLYSGNYVQNPNYYFINQTFQDTNSARITCKTLSKETSYLMITTASSLNPLPGTLPLRVFAVSTDLLSASTVTHATLLDYRKLPYSAAAMDLVTPMDAQFQDPLVSIFSTATDFFQLGYDTSNISNNLLDWIIQGTNQTFYDPNSIEQFSTISYTGLRYIFQDPNGGSATPAPEITSWNLFFPSGTSNTIADSYIGSNYNTSSFTIINGSSNEFTLMNWFNSITTKESYWKPLPYGDSNYLINCSTIRGGVGVFQTCVNPGYNLQGDISTNSGAYDSNGLSGLSFFLPPGEVVSMKEIVLKFGYTAPTFTDGTAQTPITRTSISKYSTPPDWVVSTNSLLGDNSAGFANTPYGANSLGFNRFSIDTASTGEIYFTYTTRGTITGGTKTGEIDIVLVKLNSNGTLTWAKQNNSFNVQTIPNGNTYSYVSISPSGYVYLTIVSAPPYPQSNRITIYRINPATGAVLAQSSPLVSPGSNAITLHIVTKTDSLDNIVLFAFTNSTGNNGYYTAYKYNSSLTPLTFNFNPIQIVDSNNGNLMLTFIDLDIDSMDNCVFTFGTRNSLISPLNGVADIVLIKTDSDGNGIWSLQDPTMNTPGYNQNPCITIDSTDTIYIGYSSTGYGTYRNALSKIDSNGNVQWLINDASIGTTASDNYMQLRVTSDNCIIGIYNTTGVYNYDNSYIAQPNIAMFKINTEGIVQWSDANKNINVSGINVQLIPAIATDSTSVIGLSMIDKSGGFGSAYISVFKLEYKKPIVNLASLNSFYSTQSSDPDAQTDIASWDDLYLPNRQNLRIAIFPTAQISSITLNTLAIESSICTLSLSKITQVNNYTYTTNSIRKRQPEWGTYYTYKFNGTDRMLWAPTHVSLLSTATNWEPTPVPADLIPTYVSCMTSNEGYFETEPTIYNYNGLERNYGIAPSVGFTVSTAYSTISNWVSDIPNSYTMLPFYWNTITSNWTVGSWFGLTFTTQPQLPPASTLGASPYYGPPGFMGWTAHTGSMTLASTGMTTFKPVYWNAKISFNQMNQGYEPQNDLTAFGGETGISGELQDTRMFFYQNLSTGTDLNDIYISTTGYYVYGAEKAVHYKARNDNGGYNYLSFLPNLTVRSSIETSTCEYAVHVRGQVPTVQFTTGLRVIGKNYTDFGTVQLAELLTEISSLSGYVPIGPSAAYSFVTSNTATINQSTYTYQNLLNTNNSIRYNSSIGNYFSFDYADALITFDRQFSVGTATYGINAAQAYPGVTFNFYNFSTALSSYIGFYNANFSGFSTIIGIYAEANSQLQAYISTSYNGILPPQFISRSRYTDPLTFSLPFSTTLVAPYITAVDEWGLGWNLGFAKADTPFAVSQTSQTFIRIVADYLYLQLNESYNMNGMSVTEPENLSLTRDAMGQNQRYFAKILLNDFGSISRTAVQMPKDFSPATNKFDTFSFQLVDKLGQPIVNTDCDSDLTLQIIEERIDLKIDTHPAQNVIR
jgi:hypothetical protein